MATGHEDQVTFSLGLEIVVDCIPARLKFCMLDLEKLVEHGLLELHVVNDLLVNDW
jgi:hypothetical protein